MDDLGKIRREYTLHELDEKTILADPFGQFSLWMNEALLTKEPEANAMVLSTVNNECKPDSRIVLLKQYDQKGFDFFTNYHSKKGQNIEIRPFGSLLFFWPKLERQVRIEGNLIKVAAAESDSYFQSRPKLSQLAAWASPQSTVIPNRKTLKDWFEEMEEIHLKQEIKRPPHWGGYRLVPDRFEFWQGRENRLHDRIEYILTTEKWDIRRLAP
jgi:pyridoxamine 5'-phosphate oxidase